MSADQHGNYAPIIIAISSKDTERLLAVYLTIFLGFGLGVVLVGALLTRMLVTSTFTPLREVERTAAAIADGDFGQRLGGATPNTEVGRLNRSLNTMLNRIDRAFRDRARTIEQMRRFVGDASHELRTPLVSVRGYAELYRMGALQSRDEVAQAMDRIEKEAIRMGGLVEDLLALARLDEAKPLELAEVDLVPLARDAALDAMAAHPRRTVTVIAPEELAEADAASPAPELEVELEADLPPPARSRSPARRSPGCADDARAVTRRRLAPTTRRPTGRRGGIRLAKRGQSAGADDGRRRLGDRASPRLVEAPTGRVGRPRRPRSPHPSGAPSCWPRRTRSARSSRTSWATRSGSRPTTARSRSACSIDDAAERAMVEVVDHGEGIPPQIREKIFQRFWRADTSRTRETGGSGLGLAIVSSIVAAHNGIVDVVETPGGGATFRVSLPLAGSAAAPQRVLQAEPTRPPEGAPSGCRVRAAARRPPSARRP